LKGKKCKRHILYKSDWLTYWGSSNSLTDDILEYGIKNFSRKITRLCLNKFECSYYEAEAQFKYKVLLSDKYYNKQIRVRVSKK